MPTIKILETRVLLSSFNGVQSTDDHVGKMNHLPTWFITP
jgi:hypothetical protein